MGIGKILPAALLLAYVIRPACGFGLAYGLWPKAFCLGISITKLPNYSTTQFPQLTQSLAFNPGLSCGLWPVACGLGVLQIPAYPKNPPPEKSQTQKPDLLQPAEALLEKQQYADAANELQSVIKTQTNNPQAWFDLGFAQSHLGKLSEAVAAYRKAVELSPKWFEANLNLGLTLARGGASPEAASALRAATQLKPTTGGDHALSNAWLSLAEVVRDSSPQEAIAAFQKAAQLEPKNAAAFLGAGRLMQAQGDYAGAEQAFLETAENGENDGLELLIALYLKQNRLPEAETWLRKYLAANPQNTVAEVQLGRVLAAEGKAQEATTLLEPLRDSPDPAARRELASLYIEAKKYDAAATLLRDLVQKNPVDAQLHWNLGSALLHQLNYPEAETEMLQALQLNKSLDVDYWELAYAAQQNKHYELAIRALDLRARHQPETAATYWIRAVSYDGLRLFKPAAENYKLFLDADAGKSPDDEFKARHRLKAIQH